MDQMCIITGKAGEDYRRILVPIGSDAERLNVIILPWLGVAGKKWTGAIASEGRRIRVD